MVLQKRSLDVMSAYSITEQRYLYEKTRELKQAYTNWDYTLLQQFKITDPTIGIYEVFLEDSTRTKESFRNAIEFHQVRGKIFDSNNSSFNKYESYADTFNMLTWYDNQIFIVRSTLEGVCTWLDSNAKAYTKRQWLPYQPIFINAGDGRHEHPTQEFLDQFTFLEHNQRNTDTIHIALIGDLLHGRTTHSKVEGLRIYKHVTVDLIAPSIVMMPDYYIQQMKEYWYTVRLFGSLDEYITTQHCATIWYFTRLQIERLGDDILQYEGVLREAITIKKEQLNKLDTWQVIFFHPLPRHKIYPEIPSFLDNTPLNGREKQSINGYFMRIILLAASAWVPYVCNWFTNTDRIISPIENDRYKESTPKHHTHKHYSEWVMPIENGFVIDHIFCWGDIQMIKKRMSMIVKNLWLYGLWGERVSTSTSTWLTKGMIFCPNASIDDNQIVQLAVLSPWCTLNTINNKKVIKKIKLQLPSLLHNISGTQCNNIQCISHKKYHESVPPSFMKYGDLLKCSYCSHCFKYYEIREER